MKPFGNKIACIILNYRSSEDTIACVTTLRKQLFNDFFVVIVDNSESVFHEKRLIEGLETKIKGSFLRVAADNLKRRDDRHDLVLITNAKNRGYSTGNNIGIRYALNNSASAILITNPDIRFPENTTISKMVRCLEQVQQAMVIGPRVVDLEGNDQNPMVELSFIREMIQPITDLFGNWLGKTKQDRNVRQPRDKALEVDKVSGCCLMIRSSFLRENGLLDESTFLYCEEPILAHKVRASGGGVYYYPGTTVEHHHHTRTVLPFHYRLFIRSRLYYLKIYKKYNNFSLFCIALSHYSFYIFKKLKSASRKKY